MQKQSSQQLSELVASATSTGMTVASGIALRDQVASHNTRQSCWTIINGNVYDLTSWVPQHPGGEDAILRLCGKDGSGIFNRQHGGQARQAAVLAGFKIGSIGDTAAAPISQPTAPAIFSGDDDSGSNSGSDGEDNDDLNDDD